MNVPQLRFKEFDGEWVEKKLGDIFKITSGTTPLRARNEYFENGKNIWVKTTDLNNGLIVKTEESVTDLALKETSLRMLPIGTILVAMYGGFNQIGRTGLLTKPASINQALSAILPNIELIAPYYLLTLLNYKVEDWKAFAASSRKDPNITKKDVESFLIKFPSLPEQTKIANFLTAIDERINQLTRKKELMTQYKQGVMQQIFSQQLRFKDDNGEDFADWEEKKLGDITINIQSGLSRQLNDTDIGLPVIRSNNINDGKFNISDIKYWYENDDQGAKTEDYFLNNDDLLVNFINSLAQIGKSALYKNTLGRDVIFTTNILRITFNKNLVSPIFIYYFFQTQKYEKYILSITKPAVNQASFTTKEFKLLDIPIPSKAEQTKIANFLTALDEKIQQISQQIDATKQYKQGLLQQMFV